MPPIPRPPMGFLCVSEKFCCLCGYMPAGFTRNSQSVTDTQSSAPMGQVAPVLVLPLFSIRSSLTQKRDDAFTGLEGGICWYLDGMQQAQESFSSSFLPRMHVDSPEKESWRVSWWRRCEVEQMSWGEVNCDFLPTLSLWRLVALMASVKCSSAWGRGVVFWED